MIKDIDPDSKRRKMKDERRKKTKDEEGRRNGKDERTRRSIQKIREASDAILKAQKTWDGVCANATARTTKRHDVHVRSKVTIEE